MFIELTRVSNGALIAINTEQITFVYKEKEGTRIHSINGHTIVEEDYSYVRKLLPLRQHIE